MASLRLTPLPPEIQNANPPSTIIRPAARSPARIELD
jgi:hypothetical protein